MRVQSLGLARREVVARDDDNSSSLVVAGDRRLREQRELARRAQRPPGADRNRALRLLDSRTIPVKVGRHATRQNVTAAVGGVAAALGVAGLLWYVTLPLPYSAAAPSVTGPVVPLVATGGGFMVNVASFGAEAEARALASRLQALGLPAFTWGTEDGAARQVLIGPYASRDEAERVRRGTLRQEYPGAYLDEDRRFFEASLATAGVSLDGRVNSNPNVLLIAAPGRLSLVLEAEEEPRQLSGMRVRDTTFEVEAGPFAGPIDPQSWHAPRDVQLIGGITVQPVGVGNAHALRASVTLSSFADATVRVGGRRVYIDVSRSQTEQEPPPMKAAGVGGTTMFAEAPSAPAPVVAEQPAWVPVDQFAPSRPASPPEPARDSDQDYRAAVLPILERFADISTFLQTGLDAASPEVLAALSQTLRELEQTTRAVHVPEAWRHVHGSLVSAVGLAAIASGTDYTGDRGARVREATGHFDIVRKELAKGSALDQAF